MTSLLRKKKSLVMIVRHLARIIPLMTSPEMRNALGWNKLMLQRHTLVRRHIRSANVLGGRDLSSDLLKFSFLCLVKTSQAEHPVLHHTRVVNVQGLSVMLEGYEEIHKELTFGMSSLPVVPYTASDFVKALFYVAHVEHDCGLTDHVTQKHHGYDATRARLKNQVWRLHMKDLRGNFKKLLARCKFCKKTKVNIRTGNFTVVIHSPSPT